jgi:uncharacterized membrane protein
MYQLNVWIHIVMATVWTGGLIYTAAVVIPFAVSKQGDERQQIIRGLARRFRRIGWGSIFVLVITGLVNIYYRLVTVNVASSDGIAAVAGGIRAENPFFQWLMVKLLLVVLMIGLMLFHDITSLNAAKRHEGKPGSPPSNRLGSMAAALATLLAIAILYISVRIVRG